VKNFRKQHFNSSLESNTQENIKEADANDLIPFWPASTSASTSRWQAINPLCFEPNTETGYYRIEEEKE
jgi:hypothetical protein